MEWLKNLFIGEDKLPEEPKEENYTVKVFCKNCKKSSRIELKKGTIAKEHLTKIKCSRCDVCQLNINSDPFQESFSDIASEFFEDIHNGKTNI